MAVPDLQPVGGSSAELLLERGREVDGIDRTLDAAATGRGGQLEREFPVAVVRQLFERPLAALEDAERERLLSGAARFATAALTDRPLGSAPSGARGHAILHGLYWLTANLAAETPLVLVLDDAHWSDPASL